MQRGASTHKLDRRQPVSQLSHTLYTGNVGRLTLQSCSSIESRVKHFEPVEHFFFVGFRIAEYTYHR